jgi:hypothetical protein
LQPWEIDNQDLAPQTQTHGPVEQRVAEKAYLTSKDGLALGATVECIEHIEENKAGESHSCITFVHFAVCEHLVGVNGHRTKHNNRSRSENAGDKGPCEDWGVAFARWPGHHIGVDRLDSKRLGRWPIHNDIYGQLAKETSTVGLEALTDP